MLALICFVSVPASASPLNCWDIPTLEGLIALGDEGCGLGHRELFDVTYSMTRSSGAPDVAPADIAVAVLNTRFSTGISLAGDWMAPPGESVEVALSYRFRDIRATGVGVWLDAEVPTNSGSASMEGSVCFGGEFPCDSGTLSFVTLATPAWGGSTEIRPGCDNGSVRFYFALAGGDVDASVVRSVTTVVRVPEPNGLLLAGFGLAACGLWVIRRGGGSGPGTVAIRVGQASADDPSVLTAPWEVPPQSGQVRATGPTADA